MYSKKIKAICCGILMIGAMFTFIGCSDSALDSSQVSESSQLSQPEESMVSSELTNTSSDSAANSDTVIENTRGRSKTGIWENIMGCLFVWYPSQWKKFRTNK